MADHRAGNLAAAEAGYREAIRVEPQLKAAHQNLVTLLRRQYRLADLNEAYRGLLAVDPTPEAHLWLATNLLRFGLYEEAWPHYEQRASRLGAAPSGNVPEWRGQDLKGRRIMVWDEQGFGDQIQMARYLPLLRDMGAEVAFACREPLRPLMETLCPTYERYGDLYGRWDFWVSSMSLPFHFRTVVQTIPPPMSIASASGGQGIGFVTRGSPKYPNDTQRNLPHELGQRLRALPGAVSLAPEDTGATDFAETAQIIAGLERVITVDTAVGHLAASMGKPTALLITAHWPAWQWMLERRDSPWYPSVRLYRQTTVGDWVAPLEQAIAGL